MRVLAIETSSVRGSVALLDRGELLTAASHELPNAHAERILPMIRRLLAEAGFGASSLDRLAVGIGPGSFTGLRVGIALSVGLGLGLGRPVVGVGSLAAMARGVPKELAGRRCAVLDARRDEVFTAVYDEQGRELASPRALARAGFVKALESSGPLAPEGARIVLVGGALDQLEAHGPRLAMHRSPDTDLPDARWVGVLGAELDPTLHPPEPIYVRGAGATLPDLPPSPLCD
jgi:tRNA threonylcarbamoyladenosine biosynthesis protein TsaB